MFFSGNFITPNFHPSGLRQGPVSLTDSYKTIYMDINIYLYIERDGITKSKACFLVEIYYSEFSPLRASSRPG